MPVEHTEIFYGSKTLSLDVNPEAKSASIRYGTRTPSWLFRRREGETTILFKKADELLTDIAKRQGSIHLIFDTANSKMKLWVQANKELFGFDRVDTDGDQAYRITVIKKYESG
jgi:hypothetical protein